MRSKVLLLILFLDIVSEAVGRESRALWMYPAARRPFAGSH